MERDSEMKPDTQLDNGRDAPQQAEQNDQSWKTWQAGDTLRYIGSEGELYDRMTIGREYDIHEEPDEFQSMLVLDDDGDETGVLVGDFELIKKADPDEPDDAFSVDDPDLNALLNLAVEIHTDGGNHDTAQLLMTLLQRVETRLAASPAQQEPSQVKAEQLLPDEAFADEFAAWWDSDGQYVRAGGGDYEQSFAFAAWRYLYPKLSSSRQPATAFQQRVLPWMLDCFGEKIAGDQRERNHRFLEEALELVQACQCTADEAHQLVDYVFGRPAGEKEQEVGGRSAERLMPLCPIKVHEPEPEPISSRDPV